MVNEGPFGFPRVTDVGPLTDKRAEQEFSVVEKNTSVLTETGIELRLEDKLNKDPYRGDFKRVEMELKALEKVEESNRDIDILAEIENAINQLTRETKVGWATYNYDPESNIAVTGKVRVSDEFRKLGIGTELVKRRNDDMRERGVEEVWALAATQGGKSILKKAGFIQDGPLYPDDESIMYKRLK